MRRFGIGFVLVLIGSLMGPARAHEVPKEPAEAIAWVGDAWTEEGWDASLKKKYMRTIDDVGWHRRVLGMRELVRGGEGSVRALVETLRDGDAGMRVFAAQTLGFLGPVAPRAELVAALGDEETAVRLYAVDALGMSGAKGLTELLTPMKAGEPDRDVKKHIDYALLRGGVTVDAEVAETLLAWDPRMIDSAVVGEMAPDFQLTALTGETFRLSDFRGKQAVVLVFVYGDT